MKRFTAVLFAVLLLTAVLGGAALAQGKGKGQPYPPGQDGKCDPAQEEEHGGCPPGSKGKGPKASTTSAAAGDSVEVADEGYKPNSKVKAVMHSTPVELGVVDVGADGAFSTTLSIPADAEPGAHTIKFAGTGADGQPKESQLPFVVTGAQLAQQPASSPTVALGTGLIVVLLLAGGTVVFARNRNHNRRVAAEGL